MQLRQGTKLQNGKYEILKFLGKGGFGITYLANQVLLNRVVTIKEFFMKDSCERKGDSNLVNVPTQNNREVVQKFKGKFLREARMIASLSHPGIVKILDVFEENETAYYVMDYLPGGSLGDIVKRDGPMDESRAEQYVLTVADALKYIHAQRIVHLDIKPSNILLDASGSAVLIDFGISKHYDEQGEQTSTTPVGISKGYAPIEQYNQTDFKSFTPATDIYSLGATFLYLVTGENPLEATRLLDSNGPAVPESLSDNVRMAIKAAMMPIRAQRPQSIDEFCKILGETETPVDDDEETKLVDSKDMDDLVLEGALPVKDEPSDLKTDPETPSPFQLDKNQRVYMWAYFPTAMACFSKKESLAKRWLLAVVNPVTLLFLVSNYFARFVGVSFDVLFIVGLIFGLVGMILFGRNARPVIQYAQMEDSRTLSRFKVLSWLSVGGSFVLFSSFMFVGALIYRLVLKSKGREISPSSCRTFMKVGLHFSIIIGIPVVLLVILLILILLGLDS